MTKRLQRIAVCALLLAGAAIQNSAAAEKSEVSVRGPWRVFVLSGQSNMQGKGAIKHLEELLADVVPAAFGEWFDA